jgi:predicted transporter
MDILPILKSTVTANRRLKETPILSKYKSMVNLAVSLGFLVLGVFLQKKWRKIYHAGECWFRASDV